METIIACCEYLPNYNTLKTLLCQLLQKCPFTSQNIVLFKIVNNNNNTLMITYKGPLEVK